MHRCVSVTSARRATTLILACLAVGCYAGEAEWQASRCLPPPAAGQVVAQAGAGQAVLVRSDAVGAERLEMTYAFPVPGLAGCASPYQGVQAKQVTAKPGQAAAEGLQVAQVVAWSSVSLANLPQQGAAGQPLLPVMPVRVMVPAGRDVDTIEVVAGALVAVPGQWRIVPAQPPYPLVEGVEPTVRLPDPAVYDQDAPFPARPLASSQVQKKRGVTYLLVNLVPVVYQGKSGTLSSYEQLSLRVTLKAAARKAGDLLYHPAPDLDRGVENPRTLNTYVAEPSAPIRGAAAGTGTVGPCSALDSFRYVIVTNQAIRDATTTPNVRDLLAQRQARGVTGTIVLIEDVLARYAGRDDAERLRNFVIDAYSTWGTEYVLLGGDTDIIPYRGLYCMANNIPSDLYFQCLDGTYNCDDDNRWGEQTDGEDGGEVDLMAEVAIGRASAENAEEMANLVYKTLAFENAPSSAEYLHRALIAGEHLGFGGASEYATASMEEIRLGSDLHGYTTVGFASCPAISVETLYDAPGYSWTGAEMTARMNSDRFSMINHLGHANEFNVMRLSNSTVDALTNRDFFFALSQGCYPGAFEKDCIGEHFTTSTRSGAFAVVFNSRYGYGMRDSTDGPSQRIARQFWNAYFGKFKAFLGEMNAISHEDNIWCIDDQDGRYIRWCVYESNLLGDPVTMLRGMATDEPRVRYGGQEIDDSAGNDDGLVNPGDTVRLTMTLINSGGTAATGVRATVASTDPLVTITDASSDFGTIASYGGRTRAGDAMGLRIAAGCPTPHTVALTLTITDAARRQWIESTSVVVQASSLVSGHVTLDGNPLPGATIRWTGPLSGGRQTDAAGAYHFGLIAGTSALTATYGDALASPVRSVTVPPGQTGIDFAFTSASISGTVTDALTGNPITGAVVSYTGSLKGRVTTGLDGRYTIARIYGQPGSLTLVARIPGYFDSEPVTMSVPPSHSGVDFALGCSDIDLDPTSLSATTTLGRTVTRSLTIANRGGRELTWDASRYRCVDSSQPGGPVYNWVEIASTGTRIDFSQWDLETKGPFALGMRLPFYDNIFGSILVSAHGYLSFTDPTTHPTHWSLPYEARGSANMLALMWDETWTPGPVYYQVINGDTLVVEYKDMLAWTVGGLGYYTAQVVMKTDGSILYQYQRAENSDYCTVAVQNADQTQATQYSYDDGRVRPLSAVSFKRLPPWLRLDAIQGTVPGRSAQTVTVTFDSEAAGAGLGAHTWDIAIYTNDTDEREVLVPVTFTVNPADSGCPVITRQPVDASRDAGQTVTFTVAASGTPNPTFQWQSAPQYGTVYADIAGATAATYTRPALVAADHGRQYRCVATNAAGHATSQPADLTVYYAPTITRQPVDKTVDAAGLSAYGFFSSTCDANPAATYQWQSAEYRSGTFNDMAGETYNFVQVRPVTGCNGRRYRCVMTNRLGSVTSAPTTLWVRTRSIVMRLLPGFVWDCLAPEGAKVNDPVDDTQTIDVPKTADVRLAPVPAAGN